MTVMQVDPSSAVAQAALRQYLKDIADLAALSIDVAATCADVDDYRPPDGAFWVCGSPVPHACVGLRTVGPGIGEIKRMWVTADARGTGVATTLLATVEERAREMNLRQLVLDTNGDLLAARRFYEKTGYTAIERYNDNPDATHFFAKTLD